MTTKAYRQFKQNRNRAFSKYSKDYKNSKIRRRWHKFVYDDAVIIFYLIDNQPGIMIATANASDHHFHQVSFDHESNPELTWASLQGFWGNDSKEKFRKLGFKLLNEKLQK